MSDRMRPVSVLVEITPKTKLHFHRYSEKGICKVCGRQRRGK